jgi:hypothetical protein
MSLEDLSPGRLQITSGVDLIHVHPACRSIPISKLYVRLFSGMPKMRAPFFPSASHWRGDLVLPSLAHVDTDIN